MSWVSPTGVHNPTTGIAIPAAWGDASNSAHDYLATNKPSVKVTRSVLFTHNSSGNFLDIPFNQEVYDHGGCHSTVSSSERLVAPDAGLYTFKAGLGWDGNNDGRRLIAITKNGTDLLAQVEMAISRDSTGAATGECSGTIGGVDSPMAAGDYVTLRAFQDSGGDLDIVQFSEWTPWFSMIWWGTS